MLGLNLIGFIIFSQNMYVNIKTMRHVLKQPSSAASALTPKANNHMEITIEEFEAKYEASHRAGLCIIEQGTETVKIQIFAHSAKWVMRSCVFISTACFLFYLVAELCCLVFGITGAIHGVSALSAFASY